jgi:hypothetical protein
LAKDLKRHFLKKKVSKYKKRYSISLVFREMQIKKHNEIYHLTPIKIANKEGNKCGDDEEKLEIKN